MAVKQNLPEGWLTGPEARTLRRLATGKVVLEMGAFKGRSTVTLAETAKHVFSVDRHQGVEGHGESLHDYLDVALPLGNVTIVIGTFEDVVPHLWNIGMVYIDGNHDYATVQRDISLVSVLEPAIVVFHDWDFPEVKQAGMEAYGAADGLVGSVAWFRG